MKKIFVSLVTLLFATAAHAQGAGTVTNHAFALGKGPGVAGYTSLLCGSAQLAVGQAAADPICRTVSGDWTLSAAGAATLATVNANVGTFGSATQCVSVTYDAKGRATAASASTCTPAIGSVTGMSAGCATALTTPNSANLRACFTDETGTGLLYFQGGDIGTPSAGVGSNLTALNASNLSSGTLPAARLPLTSATLQAAPANPTGTTSASLVMMGLGVTTCRVAPVYSTRMRFEINGAVANTNVNGVTSVALRFNTGAGPANGAAVTGTALGSTKSATSAATNATVPFNFSGIATGLVAGTTYWFDIAISVNAGTSTAVSIDCQAMEF